MTAEDREVAPFLLSILEGRAGAWDVFGDWLEERGRSEAAAVRRKGRREDLALELFLSDEGLTQLVLDAVDQYCFSGRATRGPAHLLFSASVACFETWRMEPDAVSERLPGLDRMLQAVPPTGRRTRRAEALANDLARAAAGMTRSLVTGSHGTRDQAIRTLLLLPTRRRWHGFFRSWLDQRTAEE